MKVRLTTFMQQAKDLLKGRPSQPAPELEAKLLAPPSPSQASKLEEMAVSFPVPSESSGSAATPLECAANGATRASCSAEDTELEATAVASPALLESDAKPAREAAEHHGHMIVAPSRSAALPAGALNGLIGKNVAIWVKTDRGAGVMAYAGAISDRQFRSERIFFRFSELCPRQFFAQVENAHLYYETHRGEGVVEVPFENILRIDSLDYDTQAASLRVPGQTIRIANDVRRLQALGDAPADIPDFGGFSGGDVKAHLYKNLAALFRQIIDELGPLSSWEGKSFVTLQYELPEFNDMLSRKRETLFYRQAKAAYDEQHARGRNSRYAFEENIKVGFHTGLRAAIVAAIAVEREFAGADLSTKLGAWHSTIPELKPLMRMHLNYGPQYSHQLFLDEQGLFFRKGLDGDGPTLKISPEAHRQAERETGLVVGMSIPETIGCPALQLGIMEQFFKVLEPRVVEQYFLPSDAMGHV